MTIQLQPYFVQDSSQGFLPSALTFFSAIYSLISFQIGISYLFSMKGLLYEEFPYQNGHNNYLCHALMHRLLYFWFVMDLLKDQ